MVTLEICVDNYQSILNACNAKADRLELCSALGLDGLTPSSSLVAFAKENTKCSLQAMIRHRAGDFYYDNIDQQMMLNDCKMMLDLGVDGIVIGALTTDDVIDQEFLKPFIKLVKNARKQLTFHIALDLTKDIQASTKEIIKLGFDRVLTSGGAINVTQGMDTIQALQQHFGHDIQIMPGCGINSNNVDQILEITKVKNIHCSASKKILRSSNTTAFPSSALQIKVSQMEELCAIKSIIDRWSVPVNL